MTTYEVERVAGNVSGVVARMFAWAGLGFGVTLVTAVAAAASGVFAETALLAWIPAFALLAAVHLWPSVPVRAAQVMYLSATVLLGLGLAPAFWLLGAEAVLLAVLPVLVAFSGAAAVGLLVRRDLSALGLVVTLGLVGLLAAGAAGLVSGGWLPLVGVGLFFFATVFDVWSLREEALRARDAEEEARVAIRGAVDLYLDLLVLLLLVLQALLETLAEGLGG